MRIILPLILSILSLNMLAQQNTISLTTDNIVGKWDCFSYSLEENRSDEEEPLYVYHFRDNMTFHQGEIVKGAVIYNIAGRYSLDENIINLVYMDLLSDVNEKSKIKKMTLKVFFKSTNRLDIDIINPDNQNPISLIKLEYY